MTRIQRIRKHYLCHSVVIRDIRGGPVAHMANITISGQPVNEPMNYDMSAYPFHPFHPANRKTKIVPVTDKCRILVVDDEDAICFAFERYFTSRGFAVRTEQTFRGGLAAFEKEQPDVVFLDVRLGDGDGLDALERMQVSHPQAAVIVISAYGSLEAVTRAVRGKAFDFLVKPLDLDRAAQLVEQAVFSRSQSAGVAAPGAMAGPHGSGAGRRASCTRIIGTSPAMQEVFKRIGKVSQSDASVLILGQTGTGKDLVARVIHEHSPRAGGPMVAVNCGALPENLVESELFGYTKGAFTGADTDKIGRFEAADGGTLFLDEVGDLPPAAQVKLLRFLDNRTIERLGSVRSIPLDLRVLAATNRDLDEECRRGRFRSDLFYRLAVIQINLPTLQQRPEDILPLAAHILGRLDQPRQLASVSPRAQAMLHSYAWPGNIRELQNALQHAAIIAAGGVILPEHLPQTLRDGNSPTGGADEAVERYLQSLPAGAKLFPAAIEPLERAMILHALGKTNGNQSAAADILGLHRNTLRNKMRELGLENNDG